MRRRDFVAGAGLACVWPFAAHAQTRAKPPVVGFLGAGTPEGWRPWTDAFVRRLSELGWTEGRNVSIEYRWAGGDGDREAEIARELAGLKVDVILTVGGSSAKAATSEIPIVCAISADPLGIGLVASLARPGGNLTGLSLQSSDLAGKRIEILKEVLPNTRKLAILADQSLQAVPIETSGMQNAARQFNIDVFTKDIRRTEDIGPTIAGLQGRADAAYVPPNRFANANRFLISERAIAAELPVMFGFREYVEAGGLFAYGPNTEDMFRRAAEYVDKILHGASPADLPVEQPTKFDLTVNLKTAKALGITVPSTLLARADKVIE